MLLSCFVCFAATVFKVNSINCINSISCRSSRDFNNRANRAVALDISKAFNSVWHAGLLRKLKSHRISGQMIDFTSSFLSNRRHWIVLDGKYSQEYPFNAGVPQGFILGPTLFPLYINDLSGDVSFNTAIYIDNVTLYSKCDQRSDLW